MSTFMLFLISCFCTISNILFFFHSYILSVGGYIHIYFSWHVHPILGHPVPARSSEAHWSWVHLQWHLPSAVHDCGEISLNLQGAVLNGSHWSTFAWHCDWQSQSAYHGSGDGQTLIYRWDGLEWFWLIDRLSLSHWGITKHHLCTAGKQYYGGERVAAFACVYMHECVCGCRWSSLERLPITPWARWQLKNQAVKPAQPTSSKLANIK